MLERSVNIEAVGVVSGHSVSFTSLTALILELVAATVVAMETKDGRMLDAKLLDEDSCCCCCC